MLFFFCREELPPEAKSPPTSTSESETQTTGPPMNMLARPNPPMNMLARPQGLTFAGGIVNGGLILTQNRMGGLNLVQSNRLQGNVMLQPNRTMGILQPNKINLVRPNQTTVTLMNPSQQNVTMGMMQPQLISVSSSTVTSSPGPKAPSPIEIDLSKVKPDPDAPSQSPERTEFVNMEISVKREPMEVEELQLPDFLSEEISQESILSDPIRMNTKPGEDESNSKSSLQTNQEELETDSDSNQLFMKSILAHMNQLPPYHQSMFKMKVQQLLHDMMFPVEAKTSAK